MCDRDLLTKSYYDMAHAYVYLFHEAPDAATCEVIISAQQRVANGDAFEWVVDGGFWRRLQVTRVDTCPA